MFISSTAGSGWVSLHDPLLGVSMTVLFWIVGATELAVGLVCLFGKEIWLKAGLTVWLAAMFLVYQLGLVLAAGPRAFAGYWSNLQTAFHLSSATVCGTLIAAFVYLLLGGAVSLFWSPGNELSPDNAGDCVTVACPDCGGHIASPVHRMGQQIECPHCGAALTLREPG